LLLRETVVYGFLWILAGYFFVARYFHNKKYSNDPAQLHSNNIVETDLTLWVFMMFFVLAQFVVWAIGGIVLAVTKSTSKSRVSIMLIHYTIFLLICVLFVYEFTLSGLP